jgi:hypothetical protein
LLLEDRGGKPIRVIKVVLDGQDFVVSSLALKGGNTLEELTKKVGGDTSINGTFFCPKDYVECDGVTHSRFERIYMWDAVSYSTFWPSTDVRVVFGFDKNGEPLMVQNNKSEMMWLWSNINKERQNDLYFWLSNFTVLLLSWENVAKANEMYYDAKMYSKINRNFICSTPDKQIIYMGVVWWISIIDLADYVKQNFDCNDALALDAGYSSAMVYDSKVLERSNRRQIMDAFVVLDRTAYIDLTQQVPPVKEAYIPSDAYELNTLDKILINKIYAAVQKIIKKKWSTFKRNMIKALRAAVSSDIYKDNIQRKAVFHELLVKLYTIGTL